MGLLKKLTLEEQAQKDAERQRREAEAAAEREREEAQKREAAFRRSPAGQARTAFERGDFLFQFEMDVKKTDTYVIPMMKAGTLTNSNDPTEILNSVCREGWALVNASFVFHETGSESRDKFMASGQHVAVKGTVIGYYVFRREEQSQQIAA